MDKERDIGVFFGAPPVASAPEVTPEAARRTASAASNPQKTASATEEQKTVAAAMGNPDAAAQVASAPEQDPKLNLLKSSSGNESAPVTQPWYQQGTVSPNNDSMLPLGSQVVTNKPVTQATTSSELKSLQGVLENEQNVQSAAKSVQQQQQEQYENQLREHQARLAEAQARHDQIEAEHKAAIEAQRKAMLEHAHAQTLTPEEEFERRQQAVRGQPRLKAPETEIQLNKIPVGGLGTYEYAIKSGATPEQAMRVPSMSAMQQQNIPELARGYERASNLPGGAQFNRYEGAPNLALTEDVAREYVKPKLEAQAAIEQRNLEHEAEKTQIARDIAKHKAGTKHALEVADLDLKEAKEKLKESHKHLSSHKAPEAPKQSANDARENARQENKIKELEAVKSKLKNDISKIAPRLNVGGFDEYTNTYPIGGAGDLSYAHELLTNLGNRNIDPQTKDLFLEELKKLQAKNPRLLPILEQHYIK